MRLPDAISKISDVRDVLIVEDHHDALQILAEVVEKVFKEPRIHTASTVSAGKQLIGNQDFQLALMDIGLPDGSGLELVSHASTAQPNALVIVTTIFDDDNNLFEALRAGAAGYLLKGYSIEELQNYLQEVYEGKPALSPGIAQSLLNHFRPTANSDESDAAQLLTGREREILKLVATGSQTKEVARLLNISSNTVAHHTKSIYSKLNVHNRTEAALAAQRLKLV